MRGVNKTQSIVLVYRHKQLFEDNKWRRALLVWVGAFIHVTGKITSLFLRCAFSTCSVAVIFKFILSDKHNRNKHATAGRRLSFTLATAFTPRFHLINYNLRPNMLNSYLLVRFELFFNFVLPNFVCAKVAVVKRTGSCWRPRNVDVLPLAPGLLFLYMGLADDVGDESLGEPFGLNVKPFSDELMISMGRKHWASGLKVEVTSRSALLSSGESCLVSEYRIYVMT